MIIDITGCLKALSQIVINRFKYKSTLNEYKRLEDYIE